MANICISAQHGISSGQVGQFSQNSLKCGENFCEPFAKRNETPRTIPVVLGENKTSKIVNNNVDNIGLFLQDQKGGLKTEVHDSDQTCRIYLTTWISQDRLVKIEIRIEYPTSIELDRSWELELAGSTC